MEKKKDTGGVHSYNNCHLSRCFCRCFDVLTTDIITFTHPQKIIWEKCKSKRTVLQTHSQNTEERPRPTRTLTYHQTPGFPRALKARQFNLPHQLLSYRQEEIFQCPLPTARVKQKGSDEGWGRGVPHLSSSDG